jgi:hypothetical protein
LRYHTTHDVSALVLVKRRNVLVDVGVESSLPEIETFSATSVLGGRRHRYIFLFFNLLFFSVERRVRVFVDRRGACLRLLARRLSFEVGARLRCRGLGLCFATLLLNTWSKDSVQLIRFPGYD